MLLKTCPQLLGKVWKREFFKFSPSVPLNKKMTGLEQQEERYITHFFLFWVDKPFNSAKQILTHS